MSVITRISLSQHLARMAGFLICSGSSRSRRFLWATPDVNPELGYSSNIHLLHAPLPETPLAVSPEDGWVTFFDEAGYVSRCKLTYQFDGVPIEKETGRMALGNKIRYEIPGRATQIRVMGEGETGLDGDWWRVTFDKSYDTPPRLCFKSQTTTLEQHWNNACT